ncbi:MAG TPA: cytochrome c oxidase subunit 3 [Thermoanaerobaculia bacterium]
MTAPRTLDLDASDLPRGVLDSRSLVWWGTIVMTVTEGMVFAISVGGYFYLRTLSSAWPPTHTGPPDLTAATVNLGILLLSAIPAVWLDRAGKRQDARMVRLTLAANLVFGTAFCVVRVFEFKALHCMWNSSAYGSITWTILGLHTSNLLTSLLETLIVFVYVLVKPIEERHFLDARLDGVFWYFIVVTWIPLYVVLFLVPRIR